MNKASRTLLLLPSNALQRDYLGPQRVTPIFTKDYFSNFVY